MNKIAMSIICGSLLSASYGAEIEPSRVLEYKKTGNAVLTLHIFDPVDLRPGDKRPAIVFFFGGGWKNGTPTQFYKQSEYFASRGMVAICADYRTEEKYHTTPQECVKDGKSAVRWIRSHAAELGVDPDRIAAGGGSAGGHVAAATALIDSFNEEGEDTSVSCRPNALVLFNPVFDNGPDGYGYDRVKEYWHEFSPMNHIDKEVPPTLVMLGTKDQLIPVATAEKYKTLMEQAGVRCDLRLYVGEPHGFFNQSKYTETLRDAEEFLISLGFLDEVPRFLSTQEPRGSE